MNCLRMDEIDLRGRRVLIREDFNLPLRAGKVSSDARIRAALPSIELARNAGAKVILMSHLGRPVEGVPISRQRAFSLQPVAARLESLLRCEVTLVDNYLEQPSAVDEAGAGVVMLENVRINRGEQANAPDLARRYAALADVFVMDAFATAHRAHASTCGVARFTPLACAGPLLLKELEALDRALTEPQRPLVAIVGGAKVSGKLQVLESLARRVDRLIPGGGIANTLLLAAGVGVGRSLCEPELADRARELMRRARVSLPVDVVVAEELTERARAQVKPVDALGPQDMIADIGPVTAAHYSTLIAEAGTIFWNGPAGVFEFDQFAAGTREIARAVAANPCFSLAGGGETIAAMDRFAVREGISFVSTGGGAFLEYVAGAGLPALESLQQGTIARPSPIGE